VWRIPKMGNDKLILPLDRFGNGRRAQTGGIGGKYGMRRTEFIHFSIHFFLDTQILSHGLNYKICSDGCFFQRSHAFDPPQDCGDIGFGDQAILAIHGQGGVDILESPLHAGIAAAEHSYVITRLGKGQGGTITHRTCTQVAYILDIFHFHEIASLRWFGGWVKKDPHPPENNDTSSERDKGQDQEHDNTDNNTSNERITHEVPELHTRDRHERQRPERLNQVDPVITESISNNGLGMGYAKSGTGLND